MFLPFIPLLKGTHYTVNYMHYNTDPTSLSSSAHCDAIDMNGITDFRALHELGENRYFYPLSELSTASKMRAVWSVLADPQMGTVGPMQLGVLMGRVLDVPRAYTRHASSPSSNEEGSEEGSEEGFSVCLFKFEELCDAALGAADYMAVALQFDTVLLEDIPLFDYHNRNQMRRFITLIDVLYDSQVQLVCSAQAEPAALYTPAASSSTPTTPTDELYHLKEPYSPTVDTGAVKVKQSSDADADADAVTIKVEATGGSVGRPHTTLSGGVEWSGTGLQGLYVWYIYILDRGLSLCL